MKAMQIIQGAAYIGPYTEFGFIPTLAVIVVGIFLFWILYNLVLKNLRRPKEEKEQEVVKTVKEPCESVDADGITKLAPKEEHRLSEEEIVIPMSGRLMPISEVPDPIFSEKMVGDGFAIEPIHSEIFSPVNGQIMQIYSNKDAFMIKSTTGREVILHIGLNTSELKGEGIQFEVREGDAVNAGDLIGRIELDKIVPLTASTISPVVFPNLKNEKVVLRQVGMVEAGMREIIVIEKQEY